jgi:hypothetical protein
MEVRMRRFIAALPALGLATLLGGCTSVTPKAGPWGGETSVSFVVESGLIRRFEMTASRSSFERCRLRIPQIPITRSGSISLAGKGFTLRGQFDTPTSIQGKVTVTSCAPSSDGGNAAVFLVPLEDTWNAKPR